MTRVRATLAGSRAFTLGGGRLSLRPSGEVGLRRDGGDAETRAGIRPPHGRRGVHGEGRGLTTSQSQSMRIAAKCCFTVGADPGCVRVM